MRVLVTGATGFVGSAVVQNLRDAGHTVLALARSDAAASALAAQGLHVVRGALEDPDSLRAAAAQSDGVIHTAFNHDFSRFQQNCEADRQAIAALAAALAGSARPLVVTSGIGILPQGAVVDETTAPATGSAAHPRAATEQAVAAAAAQGVHVSVLRLPPTVHGEGDHGFVPLLIQLAREKNLSAYIGDGSNRWPAVHRHDAAALFRLALERGAAGACYHGVAEEGVPFRQIAEVIGQGLGVPTASLSPAEAGAHFGWFAHFAAMDVPADSRRTRETLGWAPTGATLHDDLRSAAYFRL